MNVTVIGSGGREHALAWKLAESSAVDWVFMLPGNGGTATMGGKVENVPIPVDHIPAQVSFARENNIDLTVVGPEQPLGQGVVDAFQEKGLLIFGPTRAVAKIETSKRFGKELMGRCGVETAPWQAFSDFNDASAYARSRPLPVVLKADGLAGGKGARVCRSDGEINEALDDLLVKRSLGEAGALVVIEDYVHGDETSIHGLVGRSGEILMLPPSRDAKTLSVCYPDGTVREAMTGGMGAYAPVPGLAPEFDWLARARIVEPLVKELVSSGSPYTGCIYPGVKGVGAYQCVLECNIRFGDPETQPLMMLLEDDLFMVLYALARGVAWGHPLRFRPRYAVCVVVAAEGYPLRPPRAQVPIFGLETAVAHADAMVFHAGTAYREGQHIATGGRTLGVTALGSTLGEASMRAYETLREISFEGMQFRADIGKVQIF